MAVDSAHNRLAILGTGKMCGILIEAFLRQGLASRDTISATVHHQGQTRSEFSGGPISLGVDNRAAARDADIILLCVKPQTVGTVLNEIRPELNDSKLIISIGASVPTACIEQRLTGPIPVIRAMPDTPSMVGAGITAICRGKTQPTLISNRRGNCSTPWARPS